jgi:hypothetical protein
VPLPLAPAASRGMLRLRRLAAPLPRAGFAVAGSSEGEVRLDGQHIIRAASSGEPRHPSRGSGARFAERYIVPRP